MGQDWREPMGMYGLSKEGVSQVHLGRTTENAYNIAEYSLKATKCGAIT